MYIEEKGRRTMIIDTKCFGRIDIGEEKVVTFDSGLMGFEEYKRYTILYDISDGERATISWLQSMDEPGLALPIIDPFFIKPDYNPTVEGDIIDSLGEFNDENMVVFVTLTVPSNLKNMTANLRAPIVINADTRKACQVISENTDYPIKFNVYDAVQAMKEGQEKGVQ